MSLSEKLRQAREEKRWTLTEAGENAGIDPNMIYEYETARRKPSVLALRGLAALYERPLEWFTEEESNGGRVVREKQHGYDLEPIELHSVEVVGAISAGGLVESWQEDLGTHEVPSYVLREAPKAFALRVAGNSLASDGIFDADIVIVDPQAPFVDGKIYAVRIDSQEVAARKVYSAGSRKLKLVSGDGDVTEVTRNAATLIGRIRWSFREHR